MLKLDIHFTKNIIAKGLPDGGNGSPEGKSRDGKIIRFDGYLI